MNYLLDATLSFIGPFRRNIKQAIAVKLPKGKFLTAIASCSLMFYSTFGYLLALNPTESPNWLPFL